MRLRVASTLRARVGLNVREWPQSVYNGVLVLHVVALVLCCGLGLLYLLLILRPTCASNLAESKRTAELLSLLPQDVDVTAALQLALQVRGPLRPRTVRARRTNACRGSAQWDAPCPK